MEAEFRADVAAKGGRIVALERFSAGRHKMRRAQSRRQRQRRCAVHSGRCRKCAGDGPGPQASGVNLARLQLLGTGAVGGRSACSAILPCRARGTWPRSERARTTSKHLRRAIDRSFGSEPARTATLSYDAVTLIAALTKTQGTKRFAPGGADQLVGFHRHRRSLQVPLRRIESARARGIAGHAVGRSGDLTGAAFVRVRHLIDPT